MRQCTSCIVGTSQPIENRSIVGPHSVQIRVLCRKSSFVDRDHPLQERLCVSVAAAGEVQPRKVVEDRSNVGIFGPESVFSNGDAVPVKQLGFIMEMNILVEASQIIVIDSKSRMVVAQNLFVNFYSSPKQRHGLDIVTSGPVEVSNIVQQNG